MAGSILWHDLASFLCCLELGVGNELIFKAIRGWCDVGQHLVHLRTPSSASSRSSLGQIGSHVQSSYIVGKEGWPQLVSLRLPRHQGWSRGAVRSWPELAPMSSPLILGKEGWQLSSGGVLGLDQSSRLVRVSSSSHQGPGTCSS